LGYKGFNQFVLVVQRVNGGDHTWEADSNGNEDAEPRQDFRMANGTLVSRGGNTAILFRGGGDYQVYNSVVTSQGAGFCLDVDGAATVQAAGAAGDEKGPPVFQSVFMSCPNSIVDDGNVLVSAIRSIFTSGANNAERGTSNLVASAAAFPFINGPRENRVATFDAAAIANSFNFSGYETVDYIGAVKDGNDARFKGWTCGIFTGDRACTDAPTIG
jgi:hypothetical protein